MTERSPARRLRQLPIATVLDHDVRVAENFWGRLLGLARLDRDRAGSGLLVPRCSSVHTFGMRFPLDLHFLGERGECLEVRRAVPPRRIVSRRGANAVLEIPAEEGGEFSPPSP